MVGVVLVIRMVGVILVMVVVGIHFVHDLHRRNRREHETVHHAPGRSQQTHHVVGKFVVGGAAGPTEPVFTDEAVAQPQAGLGGRDGPEDGLQRLVPQSAFGHLRPVQVQVTRVRPDNPVASETVPQRHRDDLFDHRVLLEKPGFFCRDVAHRRVDVEHRRKHQLHGAALGTHHHVDGIRVRAQPLLELLGRHHQQGDGRCTEREQRHIQ